jgi:hypothetical protein
MLTESEQLKRIQLDTFCLQLDINVNRYSCGTLIFSMFIISYFLREILCWLFSFIPPAHSNRTLFDHVDEGGSGLKPYCDLLPGGKYGNFFQDMQDLYYYMLMLTNGDSLDDRIVSTYDNICLRYFSIHSPKPKIMATPKVFALLHPLCTDLNWK